MTEHCCDDRLAGTAQDIGAEKSRWEISSSTRPASPQPKSDAVIVQTSTAPLDNGRGSDGLVSRTSAKMRQAIAVGGRIDLTITNNFDLIRLFAAAQVMVGHVVWHVGHQTGPIAYLLGLLPGVPVFFFTSGFLISGTYERNPNLRDYTRNRILRIYPALWLSIILSLLLIVVLYPPAVGLGLFGWAIMQGTIFQDWNPPFLRGYGIGVVNGSLWTIPVELCFYAATPIIYRIGGGKHLDRYLLAIMIVSFGLLQGLMGAPDGSLLRKAALLTPFPWLGMFVCGVLARRHLQSLRPLVEGQCHVWAALFICVVIAGRHIEAPLLFRNDANGVGLLHFVAMTGLVLSAACTRPLLAGRVLRRHDISYGIYLLHMPIINALVETGARSYVLSIGLTLLAATASWVLIERPALRLKRGARRTSPLQAGA